LAAVALAALLFLAPLAGAAKKKPTLDTYAVVSGSVFDTGGYALPDADVTLAPEAAANLKPMRGASDARGEFVFHVPSGPANYSVTVSAKGFQTQRKTAQVKDQERVEVTFQLERESK
jgi:hypothetical protein